MVSPTMKALANLAAQLGVPANHCNKDLPGEGSSSTISNNLLIVWDDEDDCDFSSFPSLSLEESPGNYHTGIFTNRGDVESHVESLLSRPILLGKEQEEDSSSPSSSSSQEEPQDDSLDEFFVDSLHKVPTLMLSNLGTSFSTLMNSRLRAYATFLTRHALSLATANEVEGVMGIEHKLETMLEIGSQVTVGCLASEFTVLADAEEEQQQPLPSDPNEEKDDSTFEVFLPLKMEIHMNVSLPHVNKVDGNEFMKVSFQASGKICGIFSKKLTNDGDLEEPSLLRVAEVNLNMHELLTGMAEQASRVISCIIDMTNAAYTIPLPAADAAPAAVVAAATRSPDESSSEASICSSEQRKRQSVSDDDDDDEEDHHLNDYDEEDDIVSLSPEKCATIVDCLIGELDDTVLSPSSPKKLKVFHPPQSILTDF